MGKAVISERNATMTAMTVQSKEESEKADDVAAARWTMPESHVAVIVDPESQDIVQECLLNSARTSSGFSPHAKYGHDLSVTCCNLAGQPSRPGCAKAIPF